MKSFSPMSPEEKRARSRANRLKLGAAERIRERNRAAYGRDPEKYRALAFENRRKPGAAERHKEYVKA